MRTILLSVALLGAVLNGCGGGKGGGGSSSGGGGGGGGAPYPGSGGDGTDGVGVAYGGGHPITWLTTDGWTLGQEDRILDLVNNERVASSLGALTMVLLMRQTARGHSVHMTNAYHDFFAHVNPEGDDPSARYLMAGGAGGCGENIAAGYADADAAFAGWMGSPGHYANIHNAGYTKTGTGYSGGTISAGPYTKVYTQMFQ